MLILQQRRIMLIYIRLTCILNRRYGTDCVYNQSKKRICSFHVLTQLHDMGIEGKLRTIRKPRMSCDPILQIASLRLPMAFGGGVRSTKGARLMFEANAANHTSRHCALPVSWRMSYHQWVVNKHSGHSLLHSNLQKRTARTTVHHSPIYLSRFLPDALSWK